MSAHKALSCVDCGCVKTDGSTECPCTTCARCCYTKHADLLTIKDIGLNFGSKVVLANVSATVRDIKRPGITQGQVVCFLGPSGVGKTRLSRLIAGLDRPTSGS